ncbi:MAG: aromatic hydrocarbon degradation protein [Bacteroidota bacterium]|nr:aromatic hydrocarbon degradation protein [Bacteroidota bacterium]
MKKVFFVTAIIVSVQNLVAQEPADALRFSWTVPNGTARQLAVGGAMGSLGGDISATYMNPAGLGFYKTSDFVFTPGYQFLNNKSTYFGRKESDKKNNFSLGTTGVVLGAGTRRSNSNIKSSAFSIAVNRTANFNSNILYRGLNTSSSHSQKFLEELKNNNIHDASAAEIFPFGTSLAINTYWIDTANGWSSGNREFRSLATPLLATGLLQENKITNKGGITEFALGGGANFNEKFYVGGTLGIPILYYEREATFTEADATSNANNQFDFASITENLQTKGVGLNIKAGLIFKPVEFVRLGLAIHSPTFFSLTDNYSASVTTDTEEFQGEQTQNNTDIPGSPSGEFKYMLMTPYRIIASASYVLREVENVKNQKGFLTADIEYINYKASSFSPDQGQQEADQSTKDYLKSLNKAIDNAYKGTFNFRVGGELKFTTIMVRVGAAYYGNPYKNIAGEKGNKLLLSGGLGYRNKGMFIDLSYVHNITKDYHIPYRLQNTQNFGANIKGSGGNAVLTVGFKI